MRDLSALDLKGIEHAERIVRNGPVPVLVEEAIQRREGILARDGILVARTGTRTGRSPQDKFIVREPSSEGRVAWGKVNQPIAPEHFERLHRRVGKHFRGKTVYVFDGYAGADPRHRLALRVVTEHAWHSLFAQQLFLRPEPAELRDFQPQFTILVAPGAEADPEHEGTNSEAFVVVDFSRALGLIGGTLYAGEIKKMVFTVMNYLMPLQKVFPMHCAANTGPEGDLALFFGLSGTGKTSLSADPGRILIGDDEHGWGHEGVFNFEGGCYAKCIGLTREREPQIWDAIRFGAVVENVVVDAESRVIDYNDASITENTRAAYPLPYVPNASATGRGGHARSIMFLAADAFGVLPPVARLSEAQAMYHFLSGYTAKLGGTEAGMGREPQATFSACFGAPFLPLPPRVYAEMLAQKMREHRCRCYLINTGWVGGSYGVGTRIPLAYNRETVTQIVSGALDDMPVTVDPVFGYSIPESCGTLPAALLHPRKSWVRGSEYDAQARHLARLFRKNFAQYSDAQHLEAGGPGPD